MIRRMQSPPKMKVLTDLVNELSDSLGRRELLCASDQILPERTERPIRMLELATASPLLRLRLQIVGPRKRVRAMSDADAVVRVEVLLNLFRASGGLREVGSRQRGRGGS